MIVIDYLLANTDRHYNNFGAIRNANSLEWIGSAPIYDSGTSLWCNTPTKLIRPLASDLPFLQSRSKKRMRNNLNSYRLSIGLTLSVTAL